MEPKNVEAKPEKPVIGAKLEARKKQGTITLVTPPSFFQNQNRSFCLINLSKKEFINIPINMFPVMFAMGRLPGWIAQWKEVQEDEDFKISRPRQIYTGTKKREYLPLEKR